MKALPLHVKNTRGPAVPGPAHFTDQGDGARAEVQDVEAKVEEAKMAMIIGL